MKNTLILKDNYNSFERYYTRQLNATTIHCSHYYNSDAKIRKVFTHYGLLFDSLWYGNWKRELEKYDTVIVFDSLHTSKLLKYLYKHSSYRIIYWHWNPIKTKKEKRIVDDTKDLCEHWTFNPIDAERFGMKLNNQFFFYQTRIPKEKNNTAFFVGADKGRFDMLLSLANLLDKFCVVPDFHVIDQEKKGRFYQKTYMDYDEALNILKTSKFAVEIVQEGQNGLTARALEAMFFETKLITNNQSIKECNFYNKQNIYVIGDTGIDEFMYSSFTAIDKEKLYPYSAQGWIEKFLEG